MNVDGASWARMGWCFRHLRRASGCGLCLCLACSWRLPLASAQAKDFRSIQSIESKRLSSANHPIEPKQQPPRHACPYARLAEPPPVSAVPVRISTYRPCHGIAFVASLDLASLQSVDIYQFTHVVLRSVRPTDPLITLVLRATPQRETKHADKDATM